jgi:hypothetical protein
MHTTRRIRKIAMNPDPEAIMPTVKKNQGIRDGVPKASEIHAKTMPPSAMAPVSAPITYKSNLFVRTQVIGNPALVPDANLATMLGGKVSRIADHRSFDKAGIAHAKNGVKDAD